MSNFTTYILKVNPQLDIDIYRILQIDGNATLDDLSNAIISAFQFDNDHLYLFSLNRKPYDEEGYYHPSADGGKNAAKAKLNSLGLKVRGKFLFLYDFGDDWMFDITVKKVQQSEVRTITFVTEENGELKQYPDWEDESFEEDGDNENYEEDYGIHDGLTIQESNHTMMELLSRRDKSDLGMLMKALNIKMLNRKKGLSYAYAKEIVMELTTHKEKMLTLLTPAAVKMLLRIAEEDRESVLSNMERLHSIIILQFCGLLEMDKDFDHFKISITKEAKEFAAFIKCNNYIKELEINYQLDISVTAMMNIYGVIDTSQLLLLLCNYLNINVDLETLRRNVLNQKAMWNEMQMFTMNNGNLAISSIFHEQETDYIITNREKYKVNRYKELDKEEILAVTSGDQMMLVPSLHCLSVHLLADKKMDPEEYFMLSANISKVCLLGMEKNSILEMCEEVLEENHIKFTKKIRKIVSDIADQYPCALLKGYSFDEYNKAGGLKCRQLSFLDE
ncbi:MAG: hypothetical protein WCQ54_11005 [Clostridiaceae bacterium]